MVLGKKPRADRPSHNPLVPSKSLLKAVQTVFKSVHHPQGRSRGLVYTEALVKPIGACMSPLMIGATASALQGNPVLGYLVWGVPLALVVATFWTHFLLSSTPAELHLQSGQVALQSVHDVLLDRPPDWHPLYNVRVTPEYTEISVRWNTRICRRKEWPEYEQLRDTAKEAFHPQGRPQSPSYA